MRRVFGRVTGAEGTHGVYTLTIEVEERWLPRWGQRVALFEVSDDAPVSGLPIDVASLSPAKRRVVLALVSLTEERGFAPTVTELADNLDLAKATVHTHLHDLKALGWLLGGEGTRTWRLA